MCQIFAFDTFTTPNTKIMLCEMCQISKIIQHSYKFATVRTNVVKNFIVLYLFSLSSPFIFFFFLLSHSPVPSLLPQTPNPPLSNLTLSLRRTSCFSRRRCPARPRHLRAHQDADFRQFNPEIFDLGKIFGYITGHRNCLSRFMKKCPYLQIPSTIRRTSYSWLVRLVPGLLDYYHFR